jgi:hypothetical protein
VLRGTITYAAPILVLVAFIAVGTGWFPRRPTADPTG